MIEPMANEGETVVAGLAPAARSAEGPNRLMATWRRLSPWPGGRWIFSLLLRRRVPYTGTISPRILELEPGLARVAMKDRRRVRNHLRSVHAVALVNLAEAATGLAMMAGIPDHARAILVGLSIEYTKKARGPLVGECRCEPPDGSASEERLLEGILRDASGEVVARAEARWLVGPRS